MTAVFQSCLPRVYSATNQSMSTESVSHRSQSSMCIDDEQQDDHSTNSPPIQRRSFRRRGPRFTRIGQKPISLLRRLVDTIFGNHLEETAVAKKVRPPSKRVAERTKAPPTPSMLRKQFEDNEQTLLSLVSLITHLESNAKTTQTPATSPEHEQARNNNRIDDT